MVRRSIATFSCCVLFFFSTQVELAHTPDLDASALPLVKVQNKPDLPPRVAEQTKPDLPRVAEQTNKGQPATGFFFPRGREKLSGILSMPLNLAASRYISWSHKMKTFLAMPVIQQNCLATAVYFEARSESMVGQLAVAMVILNRAKASKSYSSICGVVYKGASHLNACQFSFACDGKPDIVDDVRAWMAAHAVTALALANDRKGKPVQILATATNYHADYVDPVWSKSLNRLTQIGRHIFYSQG
jgi:spore germination cell wall hydrolase CwlJ-like protein